MRKLLLLILPVVLFISCESLEKSAKDCSPQACTMLFATVSVKFTDSNGNLLAVKNYAAINKRTNKSMLNDFIPDTVYAKGYYPVVTDANLNDLSGEGDIIVVKASHPITNATKEIQFLVSGGKCACHVEKISGPDTVRFE